MRTTMLLIGATALALVGCSTSDDRRYSRYHHERYYVTEEHPGDRTVIVDRDGNRTYVREYESHRGSREFQNNMEPYVRGKHAESLGWNTENYYLQRGY